MAKWLETSANIGSRTATYRLFRPVDLSIVLSRYNFADAEKLLSHSVRWSPRIPDPCPDFEQSVQPRRLEDFTIRRKIFAGEIPDAPVTVNVLFLAHCTREKGIFSAAESVLRANRELAARRLPMQLKLVIAGNFVTRPGKSVNLTGCGRTPCLNLTVTYLKALSAAEQKNRLLREAGLFLFPTRYLGENQPVNLIEAMAFWPAHRHHSLAVVARNVPGGLFRPGQRPGPGRDCRHACSRCWRKEAERACAGTSANGSRWNAISPTLPPPSAAWNSSIVRLEGRFKYYKTRN